MLASVNNRADVGQVVVRYNRLIYMSISVNYLCHNRNNVGKLIRV